MARKNDYGLPDDTLQLIGAVPDLFAGGKYLQQRLNLNSRQAPSEWIAALRATGTDNNGFTQYANRSNPESASARTERRNLFAPTRLTMTRSTRPTTPVPSTEPTTPTTRTPQVMGPLMVYPDLDPVDPVDPPPVDPVDPVDPPPVNPVDPVDPPPEDPRPSIYTKPIVSDIPDEIDPSTIPLIIPEFPLDLPEIPEVPDKTGVVEIYPGDTAIPEVVGPRKGGGGDLPPEFDKYLVDEISDLLSGGGGGGKGFELFDMMGDFGGDYGGGWGGGGKFMAV